MKKRILKIYRSNEFFEVKAVYNNKSIDVVPASSLSDTFLKEVQVNSDNYQIDISNLVLFLNSNKNQIHGMEILLDRLPAELGFICSEDVKAIALDTFKHIFVKSENILPDIEVVHSIKDKEATTSLCLGQQVKKLIEFSNEELNTLLTELDKNLAGHNKFKEDLDVKIKSFRLFNKIGEQKLLSIFLMGESGIGKTQVGRVLHKAMKSKASLCKISFGNYSSKDSLNSLIGSPRGYMGSETGELPLKLERTDIGLILIDEFEKADNPVFNFFLDLLEEGKFTDSQSNVYDLDGYLIIFTSNLTPDNYLKKISPELRSRFDYVCQFQLLTDEDKKKYMNRRISQTIDTFEKTIGKSITKIDKAILYNIDFTSLNNLRKINRAIKERFAKIAENYID